LEPNAETLAESLVKTLTPTPGDLVFYRRDAVPEDFSTNELVLQGIVTAEQMAEARLVHHVMIFVDERTVFGACNELQRVVERPMKYEGTWMLLESPLRRPCLKVP